jgi:ABC-type transporter MlaC component
MSLRIRHFLRATLFALSITTLAFGAAADVAGAQTFVEKEHGAIKKLVEANAASTEITKAIDGMVDYDALAQRTMGKPCPATIPNCTNHWDELSADQKKEVTGLLRQLVEKNYRKNLQKTKDYDIAYQGGKEAGENVSRIRTSAKSKEKPRDPAVQVDYVILGAGQSYKVVDIVTEGSSMTKNYYDQFHRMFTTPNQGYAYLVQKLRDKIAKKE